MGVTFSPKPAIPGKVLTAITEQMHGAKMELTDHGVIVEMPGGHIKLVTFANIYDCDLAPLELPKSKEQKVAGNA